MIQLRKFGDRRPGQLSGGQQQRVALARALVFEPSLVLMDEPLGALDKKLREHMQLEIKQLHSMLGVTIVYVTHDQSEALTMSDRVAVFNNGGIAQIGTPDGLYNTAARALSSRVSSARTTRWKASSTTFLATECQVALTGGGRIRATADRHWSVREPPAWSPSGPNASRSLAAALSENAFEATVEGRIYLGDHLRLLARLQNGQLLTVKVGPETMMTTGETNYSLAGRTRDCRAFPDTIERSVQSKNKRGTHETPIYPIRRLGDGRRQAP